MNNQQSFQNYNNFYNYNSLYNPNINYQFSNNCPNFNMIANNYQSNNTNFNFPIYNIYETQNEIYIEHINKFDAIKISKNNNCDIGIIHNKNNVQINCGWQRFQAYAIIGIFDLNNIKYLGYASSVEETANILGSKIYVINSIELIKINNNINEPPFINNLKTEIKVFYSTKNFFYSNDYNISIPYNEFNRDIRFNNKYLMNYSLLKPFLDNNIPEYFYCPIIFGFVSCQNNIFIGNNFLNIEMDMAIIERYFNGNIRIINSNLLYIKQVELITVFRNKNNNLMNKKCSYIIYESSESINNIRSFTPFQITLIEELNKFTKIQCIINNLNNTISQKSIDSVIKSYNTNTLNNKIDKTSFASDWKISYFEDLSLENNLDFYTNDSLQQNLFYFIDINNNNLENNKNVESIKRLFWKLIKAEIKSQGLNIDIGKFGANDENKVYSNFNTLTELYENNINNNKRILLKQENKIFQEILDKYLNIEQQNPILEEVKSDDAFNKLKILGVTWNIGGKQLNPNYDISEIFTHNKLYIKGQTPDIIVVSFQEIVPLNANKILLSTNNQVQIGLCKNCLLNSLIKIFPEENFDIKLTKNIVGLLICIFVRREIKEKIVIKDTNEVKTGLLNLGNKAYYTISLKYMDKIFSIASGHFESGKEKNNKRIQTLYNILNQQIKVDSDSKHKFNDSDFWIILGDLNFRLENLEYENATNLIQEKNYDALYCMDQFHMAYEDENNLFLKNNISEGEIKFLPTYKFEKNSDNYEYNNKKVRVPAYCDRIFYSKKNGIKSLSYESVMNIRFSDHRPVTAAFEAFWDKEIK